MKRKIIKIDEEKCSGCGLCVSGCHEGALQMIDGKAKLVSELYCDGLGACIGDCPEGAITIEEREAEKYSETATIKRLIKQGEKVVLAHLKHLKDHNETSLLDEGIQYILRNNEAINISKFLNNNNMEENKETHQHHHHEGGGCPGSKAIDFSSGNEKKAVSNKEIASALTHWPIQMHLINPVAPYFEKSDLLLAADCTAFAMGSFHSKLLEGKKLAIACPKLDSNKEIYIEKLVSLINDSKINTLTVVIMEVPCCGSLIKMAKLAMESATRKIPIKEIIMSVQGDIISENWLYKLNK
ncbi:MAG: 4Fe-4S ferredoxin [Bacteroidetes bacterium GWE2_29_8]|nr:MAG: 4Fe-4S ferredoxin [Bacteroidetes bacterium GWE2_29_8]OFY24487.1 MAG: 4Fe-4S ferredoxin [Bacteroidetes bacterium GWF2_29_10]